MHPTYVDLTDELRRAIKDTGVTEGVAVAFCAHTTCALLINEWEDGALEDFRRHLIELVPHEGTYYRHDDFEIRTQNMHPDERKNGGGMGEGIRHRAMLIADFDAASAGPSPRFLGVYTSLK